MIVEPYIKATKMTFEDIEVGACYRLENGDSVYMKIKNKNVNAVALASGCCFKHNNYYKVYPVNGKFVEEK